MGEFRYGKEILNSFGEVFKKPILLLPFVYIFVLSTIFLFLMIKQGIISISVEGMIKINSPVSILGVLLLGIQGLIGLAFQGMGLIGIRDYINKEEVTCKNQIIGGLNIFWKVLLLSLLQLIIVAVPGVILIAIYSGVYLISPVAASIVGIFLVLLFMAYVLFVVFSLTFSNVMIAYDGKGAKQSIRESCAYAKQNASHVFFTLLTLCVTGLILVILLVILLIPFLLSEDPSMVIAQSILKSLVSVLVSAVMVLYMFKAFKFNGGTSANNDATNSAKVSKTTKKSSVADFEKSEPVKLANAKVGVKTHITHAKKVVKKKVVKR